jgi:hypothetical protein
MWVGAEVEFLQRVSLSILVLKGYTSKMSFCNGRTTIVREYKVHVHVLETVYSVLMGTFG